MFFDLRAELTQLFPLRQSYRFRITPLHYRPQEAVVHRFVDIVLADECLGSGDDVNRVNRFVGAHWMDSPLCGNGPPFRICATWTNLMSSPARRAIPC